MLAIHQFCVEKLLFSCCFENLADHVRAEACLSLEREGFKVQDRDKTLVISWESSQTGRALVMWNFFVQECNQEKEKVISQLRGDVLASVQRGICFLQKNSSVLNPHVLLLISEAFKKEGYSFALCSGRLTICWLENAPEGSLAAKTYADTIEIRKHLVQNLVSDFIEEAQKSSNVYCYSIKEANLVYNGLPCQNYEILKETIRKLTTECGFIPLQDHELSLQNLSWKEATVGFAKTLKEKTDHAIAGFIQRATNSIFKEIRDNAERGKFDCQSQVHYPKAQERILIDYMKSQGFEVKPGDSGLSFLNCGWQFATRGFALQCKQKAEDYNASCVIC